MASDLLCFPYGCSFKQRVTNMFSLKRYPTHWTSLFNPKPILHLVSALTIQHSQWDENNRRSAKYQPSVWNYEFLQSLQTDASVATLEERATKLEEEVRGMINIAVDVEPLDKLELINDIQRLGLTYRFEDDINVALDRIVYSKNLKHEMEKSLHATSLFFRLLRQHSFHVSQDMFKSFKDNEGDFKGELSDDVEALLSLYEASYLAFEGENLMDEAKAFARAHLNNLKELAIESNIRERVSHVLELPYHQRLHRLEARRYIETFDKKGPHNQLLLELAKLDFNMVQSLHQQELGEMSRWWKKIGLATKLSFARDRLMECFFWSLGMIPQPQFSNCRKELTKVVSLITILDDIYDVYGTVDELELFTGVVERWDVNAINTLPDYMKLCLMALYNTINDMAYETLKEKGENSLPYLIKAWSDLCKSFLQEAKWCHHKVNPTFNEYLENAWVSSSSGVLLAHSYFLLIKDLKSQALHWLLSSDHHHLLRSPATIFRLCNDLATFADEVERGETANSIACCMCENGVSEEEARQNARNLIEKAWKKMNQERVVDSVFPKPFIETAMNLARIAQCTYQHGDGHGKPNTISNNRIKLLLVEPIPVHNSE